MLMSSSLKLQTPQLVTVESSTDLSTFDNQISGHSCLLKGSTTSKYLYKPYDENEAEFYEYLSKNKQLALYGFTAPYYGTLLIPKRKLEEMAAKVSKEETSSEENDESSTEEEISPENSINVKNLPESVTQNTVQAKSEWFKELFAKRFDETNTSKLIHIISMLKVFRVCQTSRSYIRDREPMCVRLKDGICSL